MRALSSTSLLPLFRDRRYVRSTGVRCCWSTSSPSCPISRGTVALVAQGLRRRRCGRSVSRGGAAQRAGRSHAVRVRCRGRVSADRARGREHRVASCRTWMPAFRGSAFGYANLAADYLLRPRPAFRTFRGVTPMWDNTARRQQRRNDRRRHVTELFGAWTTHALEQTRTWHEGESRLLFVNAWNEWAEGNHLEPDAVHGRGYLEALRTARGLASRPPSRATALRRRRTRDARGGGNRAVARRAISARWQRARASAYRS